MFSGKAYPNWGLLAGDWGAPKMRKTNRKKIPPAPASRFFYVYLLSRSPQLVYFSQVCTCVFYRHIEYFHIILLIGIEFLKFLLSSEIWHFCERNIIWAIR